MHAIGRRNSRAPSAGRRHRFQAQMLHGGVGCGQGAGATHRGFALRPRESDRSTSDPRPGHRLRCTLWANSGRASVSPLRTMRAKASSCATSHRTAIGSAGSVLRPNRPVCINRVHSTTPCGWENRWHAQCKTDCCRSGLAPGGFWPLVAAAPLASHQAGRGGWGFEIRRGCTVVLWSWVPERMHGAGFSVAAVEPGWGVVLTHRHDRWPALT